MGPKMSLSLEFTVVSVSRQISERVRVGTLRVFDRSHPIGPVPVIRGACAYSAARRVQRTLFPVPLHTNRLRIKKDPLMSVGEKTFSQNTYIIRVLRLDLIECIIII